MFVVSTDFDVYPYAIPNLDKVANSFSTFVDNEEEKALKGLLGYAFYNELITQLNGTPSQLWIDIRGGAEYAYNDITYKFDGLKDLLIPYIYGKWIDSDNSPYTSIGEVIATAENAVVVSSKGKVVEGINTYIEKLGYFDELDDQSEKVLSQKNTLYGLLKSNNSYPTYEYNVPNLITIFDV